MTALGDIAFCECGHRQTNHLGGDGECLAEHCECKEFNLHGVLPAKDKHDQYVVEVPRLELTLEECVALRSHLNKEFLSYEIEGLHEAVNKIIRHADEYELAGRTSKTA